MATSSSSVSRSKALWGRPGLRIAAATLGCKVNQVETASLLEGLVAQGAEVVPFKEQADLYLINTCAVTARAAYESRQLVRRALKQGPLIVVATGCYVQIAPQELLERVERPVLLVGNDRKAQIPQILEGLSPPLKDAQILVGEVSSLRSCAAFPLRRFPGHSRAFLRVQDGCNAFCTYCVVPYARGPARSLPLEKVLAQARVFEKEGYQELVLTGTHLGLWGQDLDPPKQLLDLLQALEKAVSARLRLSSLEPPELTAEILAWARSSPKFCPHFHLSLQSADDEVLKAMGRRYTAAQAEALIQEIKRLFPEAALGLDVIVGFPTETDEAFWRTLEFIKRLPVTYLHVFPYSPRPFTQAASWPQVPPDRIAKRVKILRELALAKRKGFAQENLGRVVQVLIQQRDQATGLWRGLSENYLLVLCEGPPGLEGRLVSVRITRIVNDILYGILEEFAPE